MVEEFKFTPAERSQQPWRVSLAGPPGSGKTLGGIRLGIGLAKVAKTKLAVICTEKGSAALYANREILLDGGDKEVLLYDLLHLKEPYHPQRYRQVLWAAAKAGYGVVMIDSLSHAWMGTGGMLDIRDELESSGKAKGLQAWKEANPHNKALLDTMLNYPGHLIATLRVKMAYEVTEGQDRRGRYKTRIEKMGLEPEQKKGIEYELTTCIDVSDTHKSVASKDRTGLLVGKVMTLSAAIGEEVATWLLEGKKLGENVPAETGPTPDPGLQATTGADPWAEAPDPAPALTFQAIFDRAQYHGMTMPTWQQLRTAVGVTRENANHQPILQALVEEVDAWVSTAESSDSPPAPQVEAPAEDTDPTPLDPPAEGEAVAPAGGPITLDQVGQLQRRLYRTISPEDTPSTWCSRHLAREITSLDQLTQVEFDALEVIIRGQKTQGKAEPPAQPGSEANPRPSTLDQQHKFEGALETLRHVFKQTMNVHGDDMILPIARGICGYNSADVQHLEQLTLQDVENLIKQLENQYGGKAKQEGLKLEG